MTDMTRESAALLQQLEEGDADAALKGRACYALGYRHENAGRDKEGAQKDPRLLKFAETIYNRLASN